jgi:uncharacterized damage-inducible protein DinB
MTERVQRIMIPARATTPEIGTWLWALEDARARTKRMIEGITQAELDTLPEGLDNTIGTLLYHIAIIEADYLSIDVMGNDDYLPELKPILLLPVRTEDDRLSVVMGVGLDEHLRRFDIVRQRLIEHFVEMTPEAFVQTRDLPDWGYEISPEWTLYHLTQHESEHRGELGSLLTLLRRD